MTAHNSVDCHNFAENDTVKTLAMVHLAMHMGSPNQVLGTYPGCSYTTPENRRTGDKDSPS